MFSLAGNNQVQVGTTPASVLDHALCLFQDSFGCELILLDAGQRATLGRHDSLVDARPSLFVPGGEAGEVAWVRDPSACQRSGVGGRASLDLLHGAFLARRLSGDWEHELQRMQKWLQRDDKGRLAAAG